MSDVTTTTTTSARHRHRHHRLAAAAVAIAGLTGSIATNDVHAAVPWVTASAVETIGASVGGGNGGTAWGGQQSKIVRNKNGVFATYSTAGTWIDSPQGWYEARNWVLARRQTNGTWKTLATGPAGREPASLMSLPDGKLVLFAWPTGVATLWTATYSSSSGGKVSLSRQTVPGFPNDAWPYAAAGIDASGNLCLLSSDGSDTQVLHFWACRRAGTTKWITKTTQTSYRYAYAYVLPKGAAMTVVATRDTTWDSLGLPQPGDNNFAFNAIGTWTTTSVSAKPLMLINHAEEPWTAAFPDPLMNAQMDVYLDTSNRTHILYWIKGATTNGEWLLRHRVVSATGTTIADVQLPDIGAIQRIVQDSSKRFYLIGSNGKVQKLMSDGYTLNGAPEHFGLGGADANAQLFIAAPRSGTLPGKTLDVAFVPGDEGSLRYLTLTFA